MSHVKIWRGERVRGNSPRRARGAIRWNMKKSIFPVLAAAFGLLLWAPGARAQAKDSDLSTSCIGPEARNNMSTCPGAPSKFEIHQKRGAGFKSAPPARQRKNASDGKPKNPTEAMAAGQRDTRQGHP